MRGAAAVAAAAAAAAAATAMWAPARALGLAGGATGSGGGSSSGGSSSSSGGSGGSGESLTGIWWADLLVMAAVLLVVWGFGAASALWATRRVRARGRAALAAALAADAGDGYWHPHALHERVRAAFLPVQESWARGDVAASRPYVSDALYARHRSQLEGLAAQGRVNRIEDLRLGSVEIVRVHNVTDDGEDRFVARIECSARDWMEDTRTGAVVNGNRDAPTDFVQFWSFARHPAHGWVLDEIQQGGEGEYHLAAPLVNADDGPPLAAGPAPA